MKYEYRRLVPKDPKEKWTRRPVVDLVLHGPEGQIPTNGLIDSGADHILLNMEYAKPLGIDVEACEVRPAVGIEGGSVPVYMTTVGIEVEHLDRIDMPVGFIDSPSVQCLLGQVGFFDAYRIKFERDHDVFELKEALKKKRGK